jgi:dihydrofolate synthase/folylpolyglutamate synthase
LPGQFQAANAATAVAAVRALGHRGVTASEDAIRAGLAAARLPGRVEAMPDQRAPRIVLDGAHNPDKVAALATDLRGLLGVPSGARLVVLFGALADKRGGEMLRRLVPHADALVVTAPRVLAKPAAPPERLAEAARAAGFRGPVVVEPDPSAALETALALAVGGEDVVLVTGSLYLVGNVRGRWYPDDEVVLQGTPWPARA